MDARNVIKCLLHAGWSVFEFAGDNVMIDLSTHVPRGKREMAEFVTLLQNLVHEISQVEELRWHINRTGQPVYLVMDREWFDKILYDEKWRVLHFVCRTIGGLQQWQDGQGQTWYIGRNGLVTKIG